MIHCNRSLLRLLSLFAIMSGTLLILTSVAQSQNVELVAVPLAVDSVYQIEKSAPADQGQTSDATAVPSQTPTDDSADRHTPEDNSILPEKNAGNDLVLLEIACSNYQPIVGQPVACTIVLQNQTAVPLSVSLTNFVPPHLQIDPDSLSGATLVNKRFVTFSGSLAAGEPAEFAIIDSPSPAGYVSLAGLGIPPLGDVGDDSILNFATDPFLYLGDTYTVLGVTSNGYIIPGGGSAADLGQLPQTFPDPAPPNNVIAPFWTDLDPSVGGNLYAATVSGGEQSWIVIEWEDVPAYGGDDAYTFQTWLASNTAAEDISLVYQRVDGEGATSGLSVGAENATGSDGANFLGVPTPQNELKALILPPTFGEAHIISYQTTARNPGRWKNCARLKILDPWQQESVCVIGKNER